MGRDHYDRHDRSGSGDWSGRYGSWNACDQKSGQDWNDHKYHNNWQENKASASSWTDGSDDHAFNGARHRYSAPYNTQRPNDDWEGRSWNADRGSREGRSWKADQGSREGDSWDDNRGSSGYRGQGGNSKWHQERSVEENDDDAWGQWKGGASDSRADRGDWDGHGQHNDQYWRDDQRSSGSYSSRDDYHEDRYTTSGSSSWGNPSAGYFEAQADEQEHHTTRGCIVCQKKGERVLCPKFVQVLEAERLGDRDFHRKLIDEGVRVLDHLSELDNEWIEQKFPIVQAKSLRKMREKYLNISPAGVTAKPQVEQKAADPPRKTECMGVQSSSRVEENSSMSTGGRKESKESKSATALSSSHAGESDKMATGSHIEKTDRCIQPRATGLTPSTPKRSAAVEPTPDASPLKKLKTGSSSNKPSAAHVEQRSSAGLGSSGRVVGTQEVPPPDNYAKDAPLLELWKQMQAEGYKYMEFAGVTKPYKKVLNPDGKQSPHAFRKAIEVWANAQGLELSKTGSSTAVVRMQPTGGGSSSTVAQEPQTAGAPPKKERHDETPPAPLHSELSVCAAEFRTLGLPQDATKEAVRKLFLRKALKAHPDKGGTEHAYRQLHSAYEKIMDYLAQKAAGELDQAECDPPVWCWRLLETPDFFWNPRIAKIPRVNFADMLAWLEIRAQDGLSTADQRFWRQPIGSCAVAGEKYVYKSVENKEQLYWVQFQRMTLMMRSPVTLDLEEALNWMSHLISNNAVVMKKMDQNGTDKLTYEEAKHFNVGLPLKFGWNLKLHRRQVTTPYIGCLKAALQLKKRLEATTSIEEVTRVMSFFKETRNIARQAGKEASHIQKLQRAIREEEQSTFMLANS